MVNRIDDPSETLLTYLLDDGGIWVVCPKCRGPAKVEMKVAENGRVRDTAELACTSCFNRATSEPPSDPQAPECYGCGTRISIDRPLPVQRAWVSGLPIVVRDAAFADGLNADAIHTSDFLSF